MPTINKGSDYFGVLTYTGDGAASKTVVDTSAVTFQPDFVWIKGRSGATDHALYDAVRGTTKDLVSNSTAAETTQSTGLTSFVNGGFTIGNLAKLNTSGATYTAWCWKANGAGSSNTSGSITSTVSVNATAGFSVVTYTGTGANATVGHGLGVAPKMIIVKNRSNGGAGDGAWQVYHTSIGAANYLVLNTTAASAAGSTRWQSTTPTSSVFYIGATGSVNNSAENYVAYCWAEIEGFSKFGSYTGNGSADGPFSYLGFRPKFILYKNITNATYGDWQIYDTSRSTYNLTALNLFPNLTNVEYDGAASSIGFDLLSNGFKVRTSNASRNNSGNTFIFAAFAENPFKNANAR